MKAVSERILVRKIEENLWQWREVSSQGDWCAEAYYTGDINLLKESSQGKPTWLVLPGQNVVSQHVPADIKDRNQLLKILPYEIEDDVIDPIEDMHFSYGQILGDSISVAYGELNWFAASIDEIETTGADVALCGVDYLQLPRADAGWTLLLENGILLALIDNGEGFAIEQEMAGMYLTALYSKVEASGSLPKSLQLYADGEDTLYALNQLLPEELTSDEEITIEAEEASLWDIISPSTPLNGNFRSGRLSRKLPFDKWWTDYKTPIIATAAAFVLAIVSVWMGEAKLSQERKQIMVQTDGIYRQVVPSGKITEPSRQLRGLLGKSGSSSADPSNVVSLISGIAPAIDSIKNLKVKSFRYTVSKRQLQMNIEGKSYDDFEVLRGKIAEAGFKVEIKNQSAYGEVFQAQMRVSEAS